MASTKYSTCSSGTSSTNSDAFREGLGASKVKSSTPDEAARRRRSRRPGLPPPFGHEAVSLATIQKPGNQNHLLENGLVSEVIAALIRLMGPVSQACS